jgi:S-DNA-T family DNA segregation ATPase FtsK/SpoIIIE
MASRMPAPPKPAAKTASRNATKTASRNAAQPRPSRAKAAPPRPSEPSALRRALSGHEEDLVGIALVVLAVVVTLGVYGSAAGPAGDALRSGLGAGVGLGRYAVPPLLAAVGIALIADRRAEHRVRLVFGGLAGTVAALGLLHVLGGPDGFAPLDDLREAGGWVGAAAGQPLRSLVAPGGAAVVLVAVVVASLLVVTRASLRGIASGAARGARPVFGAAKRAANNMTTLASEHLGLDAPPDAPARPAPALYDAAQDPDLTPPRKERAPRKKDAPADPLLTTPSAPGEQLEIDLGPGAQKGKWKLPPLTSLHRTAVQEIDEEAIRERGHDLEKALASHGVETRLVGMTIGPTVTRYELELGPGVKVARVTSLHRDIAYALAAIDVRILAPIPGRSAIGVEVPNHSRHLVALGDLFAAPEAKRLTHPLEVAIGKDIAGRAVFMNLASTPHLLIAGATGAGKSSGINCIITSLLMRTTPEQVRLILVDPKQVEMGQYNRLPHLLTQPVVNPKKAANALQWAVREMERRYDLLSEVGFRDITGYNAAYDRGELQPEPGSDAHYERLPFIVVVVDELNDLMMVAARDVEESITRIAQKARAVGIHLIVATQRPSVNVITGVIKANIPARMAFAVSSLTDSRVILDQPGAERLVGKGDMLLLPGSSNVAQRIQGAWVSEEEVRKVVGHWRRQAPDVQYVTGVEGHDDPGADGVTAGFGGGEDADDEALMRQAMELVVRSQLGSTSMLQRKLKVGFARAGRIMDLLEQRGVVGPSEGSKARAVLMTVEELELLLDAEQRSERP